MRLAELIANLQNTKKWEAFNNLILGKIRALPHSQLLTGQTDEHEFLPAALEMPLVNRNDRVRPPSLLHYVNNVV